MGKEPTLIISAVVAALNVVQLSAIHMSTLAHVIVLAALAFSGALINRSEVTPVAQPSSHEEVGASAVK